MSLDPYASCPCGSGKKFKWCCQPIYSGIQHAWDLESNEQHEAASRVMEQVVKEHSNNAEAWGQRALLAASRGKLEEAESSLEKAFAINPNYPFGLNLRAKLRHGEGEYLGALLLARKAVEAYDSEARSALFELETLIFDCEMSCNRPLAARAALSRALRFMPNEESLQQTFDSVFNSEGRLPQAARKEYEFRKLAADAPPERRQAWSQALSETGKLSQAVRGFEALTQQDPKDAAAWFNLGLTQAWLGDNASAMISLDRYLELEQDEAAAVEAATLMEVLRFGLGMEEACDYREFSFVIQLTNPQPVQQLLQEWSDQRRLVPMPSQQEGVFSAMVLEFSKVGLITVGRPANDVGHVSGYLLIVGNILRFSSSVRERFDRIKEEVRQKLALGLTDLKEHTGIAQMTDAITEALTVNLSVKNEEEQTASVIEQAGQFFEQTWIHRPLRSLSNVTPVDAAGHGKLRKKLLGVIQFLEDCANRGILKDYPFDVLRRKLGLADVAKSPTTPTSSTDFASMSASELATVKPDALSMEELTRAYQSAYRLDAQEIAARFAEELIARPGTGTSDDRYPWYSFLIQKALREDEKDLALDRVNDGEKHDCEHNEGKRRNDYELFRAQVHAKRGEIDAARDTYQRLIERIPRDFKVRGKAAEAMMSLKQPAKALQFAEEGVNAARQANDRDSEQYLMELVAAAKRQGA